MNKIQLNVGSLADMGQRFTSAWHRAERDEPVDESHITFLDAQTLLDTLSPRRLALLRHVHRQPARSVRELAQALGRDYKNVHGDVAVLEAAGLLLRKGRSLSAPWSEVQATVSLGSGT